jgi:hypothetical protein
VLAERVTVDFDRYSEFLETSDADLLRKALLDSISESYLSLDLLRDEITSTRAPSSQLVQALQKMRNANRRASELYDQWRLLGRVPGRLQEARPQAPATLEEPGVATEETA